MPDLVCLNPPCGRTFHLVPAKVKPQGNYCCVACYWQHHRATRPSLICQNPACQKTFYDIWSSKVQDRIYDRKYCSKACRSMHKRLLEVERFWSKVDKTSHPNGCWLWTATLSKAGYGRFWSTIQQRTLNAHTYLYELGHGPVPDDMFLDRDHACQTKGCIRHFAPTKIIGNIPLYFKFYRLKHLDKFIAWGRRWRQNNKAAVNNHTRSRRAKLRGAAIVEKIDENVVYERDKGICQLCFKKVKRADKSLDHVIPISLGGNHSYQNIVLVHRSCNSIKGNRFVPQQQRLFG